MSFVFFIPEGSPLYKMICSDSCSLCSTENRDIFFDIFSMIRFFTPEKAFLECTVNLFFNHPSKSKSHDWTRLDRITLTGLMYQITPDETQSKPHHTMSQ
jgi:hypothetical protein